MGFMQIKVKVKFRIDSEISRKFDISYNLSLKPKSKR